MELTLIRAPHGALLPSSDDDAEQLRRIKPGQAVRCEIHRIRNSQFHRKFFALVRYVYGLWTEFAQPATYRGHEVQPNFDRFRRDFTILCGYYMLVTNIKGEVRVEAKSISFANMDEAEFEQLYSKAIDVALQKVLPRGAHTEAKVREAVDRILEFA